MIDLPPPTYEQTIEAISKCDIPRANNAIKYENYLQSDEITISDLGAVTAEKLRCLKEAVHPFYILTLKDQKQRAAFSEEAQKLDRPAEKAKALAWLRSKALSERLPAYEPAEGAQAFATKIEAACGLKAKSALEVLGPNALTLRSDFLKPGRFEETSAAFECLMNMFTASDAEEKGLRLGFVGNEAAAEEEKK